MRITPAWAGKSKPGPVKLGRSRDHPRVGGEKRAEKVFTRSGAGSPPRGRGKEHYAGTEYTPIGITPAWAGKSKMTRFPRNGNKDHPRVGGEKSWQDFVSSKMRGSPPRGRGKD